MLSITGHPQGSAPTALGVCEDEILGSMRDYAAPPHTPQRPKAPPRPTPLHRQASTRGCPDRIADLAPGCTAGAFGIKNRRQIGPAIAADQDRPPSPHSNWGHRTQFHSPN
ncbi:hypothetical protein [Leptothoe kymatousa]|uniref:hypothetical protein n=1 Tax=Leptothoe kymatousa TaxID=2651727 RepID=UPI001C024590|nr:hypothetical protein [Leptothoe kymatousa]